MNFHDTVYLAIDAASAEQTDQCVNFSMSSPQSQHKVCPSVLVAYKGNPMVKRPDTKTRNITPSCVSSKVSQHQNILSPPQHTLVWNALGDPSFFKSLFIFMTLSLVWDI